MSILHAILVHSLILSIHVLHTPVFLSMRRASVSFYPLVHTCDLLSTGAHMCLSIYVVCMCVFLSTPCTYVPFYPLT